MPLISSKNFFTPSLYSDFIYRLCALVVVGLACGAAVAADSPAARKMGNQALAAYESGSTDQAAQLYLRAAKLGNANAQYNIAVMRINGETRRLSEKQAQLFLQLSADQGFAHAQEMLARLIEKSQPQKALALLEQAASNGLAQAQTKLANLYFLGIGVVQSDQLAAKWYGLAAQAGDVQAQATMGAYLERGIGVAPDWQQAVSWYALAGRQGDIVAALQAKDLASRIARGEGPL
jgi:uncharacterized protein